MNKTLLKLNKFHFGESNKNIFSFKELEKLINLRPFLNTKRFLPVMKKDVNLSWLGYEWQTDESCVPISIIKKLLKENVIYIRDCARVNKKINNKCKELEKIFKRATDCHIFFSFKKNLNGLNKHKDISDNFIVLCSGAFKVEVWTNKKTTKIMHPGEYVFIPKNTYHRITPLTDKRLSCSFPIHPESKKFDEREWLNI